MILIALGANLPSPAGQPVDTFSAALGALDRRAITLEELSGFFRSAAWPDPADPPFVNAVVRVKTALCPEDLLEILLETETGFGRKRGTANAPRPLDLDLIDYEGLVQPGPPQLPHPRLAERLFVLLPLQDVAPAWRHPVSRLTVAQLIATAPPAEIARLKR